MLEATGGYALLCVAGLVAAALPVVVANPRQVSGFAKATGQLAKTDRNDVPRSGLSGPSVIPHIPFTRFYARLSLTRGLPMPFTGKRIARSTLITTAITLAAACDSDVPTMANPGLLDGRTAGQHATSSACATDANRVVSDEPSLHAAVAAAQPGDVVAIDGNIQLLLGVQMQPGVTLTCATPGSGLSFATGTDETELIYAMNDNVTVRGLALDARPAGDPIYGEGSDGQHFERNTIICGFSCGFWPSATNAVVSDNVATASARTVTGFHFQSGIDGTRIERNTLIAPLPVRYPVFGALRPRDGVNVVITDNVIQGPWQNSISSVNLKNSTFFRNLLEGARRYGLAINVTGSEAVVFSSGNLAIANRVRNAGVAGYLVRNACYNTFRGSVSLGSTPLAFVLETTTGANVVAGTAGTSVDRGAFDCDGDGVNDPNRVSGSVVAALSAATSLVSAGAATEASTRRVSLHGRALVAMQ